MRKRILSMLLAGAMIVSLITGCGSSATSSSTTSQVASTAVSSTASATASTASTTKSTATSTAASTATSTADTSKGANGKKLTLWTVFTGSDGDILRQIIDNYNKSNSDGITVEVDIMDNATLQSKLPTAISSGTGPSFVLVGIEYLQEYVNNGLIESINDFWDKTGTNKDNYYKNVVDKSCVDGTLYGVPMQYNLQYLYYNKDLFTKAGIQSAPKTFDELATDAKALTNKDAGQYGLACPTDFGYYVQYLWGNGGDVLNTKTGENLLNTKSNVDTLTWLQSLASQVSPQGLTSADADTMFQAGQVAMEYGGPWNINVLNKLGLNYGIAAVPAGSAGAFSAEGGCSYMVPKGTDDATKDAIYKFAAFWLSDPTLKEWSMKNGFPVWSNTLLKDPDITSNEMLSAVSAASTIGRDWHLGYKNGSKVDSDVMKPMIENIFMGNDVATEVKSAADKLSTIIAQ